MERVVALLRAHMAPQDVPAVDELQREFARGRRQRANQVMDFIVRAAQGYPEPRGSALAGFLADLGVDHGVDEVPHALFCGLVAPRVVEEYRSGSGRGRLWAAAWRGRIANTRATVGLGPALAGDALEDLWEAATLEPAVPGAKERLTETLASWFTDTLHELPAGVLYGANGATVAELDELDRWLGKCRQILPPDDEKHHSLLSKCEFHYASYRRYLLSRARHRSYAEFLVIVPDPWLRRGPRRALSARAELAARIAAAARVATVEHRLRNDLQLSFPF